MWRRDTTETDVRQLKTIDIADPATNAAVSTTILDTYSGVIITTTGASNAQTLQTPTVTTKKQRFTVINDDTSTNAITINWSSLAAWFTRAYIWDWDAWTSEAIGWVWDMLSSTYDPAWVSEQLVWETANQTLINKTLNDTSNDIHADVTHLSVRNISWVTIEIWQPVYVSGYNAWQDKPEVQLADADWASTFPAAWVAETQMLNNTNWVIVVTWVLLNIDTTWTPESESWSVWDSLYLSTTVWEFTNIRPTASTAQVQSAAKILRSHATLGVILIQWAGRVNDIPNAFSMNAELNMAQWTNIASATTTDIWAATWNSPHITGTTTITWFGTVQAGTQRDITFDWILILTHNWASLILPTGANITTAAWDTCTMISEWSWNWRCANYMKADWTALDSEVTLTWAETLINKRVTKRRVVVTQHATPTYNTDNWDIFSITWLNQAITSMTTNLSGTPVETDMIMIQITDDWTWRAITWWASFVDWTVTALPITTVASTMTVVILQYTGSTWKCLSVD